MVEALVALVLFEIGILALVASGAIAARDLASANRRTRARLVAAARVEILRTHVCAGGSSGHTELPGGLSEFWRGEGSGAARAITDSVAYELPAGRRSSVVVRAWALCAP